MTTSTDNLCFERLSELLTEAAARARARGRPVLVSIAEQVAGVDPLDVLESAGCAGDEDMANPLLGARRYWARPRAGFALAALGAVAASTPSGAGRFAEVDTAWSALLDDALIDDQSGGLDGVGPILVGGFSFEPDGPRAHHWRDFPSALLTLPRIQVAAVGQACWLTATVLVDETGTPDVAPAEIARLRDVVLGATASPGGAGRPATRQPARGTGGHLVLEDDRPAASWRELVASAVAAIRAGGMQKVVLARARHARSETGIDAFASLRHLGAAYPDCHVFGIWSGASVFVGASPERLVRLDAAAVQASSLAGSAPRGATPAEDRELAAALLASGKDRAEHAMVRQALVQGLASLCDDVTAPASPSLFTLPHVHHLHTAVDARLRAGRSLLEVVAELHPTPAVGGSPRDAALQFIRAHEQLDRGWYAAPVGWIGRDRGEFAVGLRSALVTGGEAWLFAGCGIVAESDPDAEFAETLLKLRPMEQALAASTGGDAG